ncbi:MAG TPA: hypothetical protein VHU40_06250 [Polyangia bacterium]|jgi:hypothetical protein|nr:hypothetical protein [Polyangia bacterium]
MSAIISGDQLRTILLGTSVSKATGVVANGATTLFTIAGGRVVVTSLVGRVTTAIGSTGSNAKLVYNPTAAGTSFDLCTAVAIETDAVEQTYYIAGSVASPGALLVGGAVGQANGIFSSPYILQAGTIEQNLSADPVGGAITWTVTYIPYDNGATLVAA